MPEPSDVTGTLSITEAPDTLKAHAQVWSKPPEEHEIYAKIGRVASNWSHVEHMLDEIIWWLTDKHDRSRIACLTGQFASTFQRHNAIMALLKSKGVLSKDLKDRIERERGRCSNTAAKRNRVVHDAWFVSGGAEIGSFRTWAKEDLKFGINEISETVLTDVFGSIQKRFDEAVKLRNDLDLIVQKP